MNAFRIYLTGLLCLVLLGLLPVMPVSASIHSILGIVGFGLSLGLLVALIAGREKGGKSGQTTAAEPAAAASVAEVRRPVAAVSGVNSEAAGNAEAEVIHFLAMLQDKGRLVDFLMDDIAGYADEEVGQAARVVYDGCRAVLLEHMTVEPLHAGEEGAQVTVPEGYRSADFQLSGKLSGSAPFQGTLLHRGWKVSRAKLPKVVANADHLPNLAPAQVEV